MLLFDKPIIAVCDSEATTNVLANVANTWSVPSQDVKAIAEAIRASLQISAAPGMTDRQELKERYDGRRLTADLRDVIASTIEAFHGTARNAFKHKMKQSESKK